MIEWITSPVFKNELEEIIYIIPPDLRVWTITCPETHYDKDKETTVLTLKSKNYYYRIRSHTTYK